MQSRHVTHLLTRYVHGQLRPAQRARVVNHVRMCSRCRAALVREERMAADLRREMPLFGQPRPGQLAHVWAGVWQQVSEPPRRSTIDRSSWLPGISMVLAMILLVAVALPLLTNNDSRVEAAPQQPRPNVFAATASPTPGVTDEAREVASEQANNAASVDDSVPQATVAYVFNVGASPAPMPQATVSPDAPLGAQP
ncbi:MAG: zf-HC2 domain-containing protein [Anaerolineae bacterium]|nr:zf-HC2 domain-containing protein [Anaerolineae bacterium]